MSNNFDWNSMLGAGGQPTAPAPPPESEKQPDLAPVAQDDANALLNAETQQAIRESTEKAKAATKAAAVGAADRVKRLAHVIRLRVSTARLERTNRRVERQAARAEGAPAPRVAKTWIYSALGVAFMGGLAVGGWLYLRKPDSATATQTNAKATPAPAPVVSPVPVEPMADPIADLDEPAAPPVAKPQPSAPAPQAESKATAVEVAKPLPPRPKQRQDAGKGAPAKSKHPREAQSPNEAQWQTDANAQLDQFFKQTEQTK